jgi:hypothetical protein
MQQIKHINLEDLNINEIGNSLQLGGFVLTGKGNSVIVLLPNDELVNPRVLPASLEDYKKVIRQMDIQEVEIFNKDGSKVILRKSQRQLDSMVSWQVFRRDNCTCRYCGRNDVPMTYDHIFLWEDGGDNTVENGVAACKKCNKTRGNMKYKDWLESDYYLRVSKNLPKEIIQQNLELSKVYHNFEARKSSRTR